MLLKKYIITSEKFEGFLIMTYQDGLFKSCINEIKTPIKREVWDSFRINMPFREELLKGLQHHGLKVCEKEYDLSSMEEQEKPGYERVKLFCQIFEEMKGRKYKVYAGEGKKIQLVPVTEAIIRYYFRSTNFLWHTKWSISNLVKFWNELQTEMAEGKPAMRFPDYYSPEYVAQLLPAQVPYYHQHLIKKGLIPVRNSFNEIVAFKANVTIGDFLKKDDSGLTIKDPKK
jgi:hypothetical protein